jgi:hypothetical protein
VQVKEFESATIRYVYLALGIISTPMGLKVQPPHMD